MSCVTNSSDINQVFIIEALPSSISGCTGVYTNALLSCSGDTSILLDTGVIFFDGSMYTNQDITANTVNSNFYFSGGTPLETIISNKDISGGTFNNILGELTLKTFDNTDILVTGFTDFYTTGATLIDNIVYFDRNDILSAYTLNLTQYSADTYITGGSFNSSTKVLSYERNDNVTIDVTLPFRLLFDATANTISDIFITIDTITGITDNSNSFISSYITAYKDDIDYGFWKRTVALNKVSGVLQIIGENSDFDRLSSGITPNNVVYSVNGGDLDIKISGETAKNYSWTSNWEIIK